MWVLHLVSYVYGSTYAGAGGQDIRSEVSLAVFAWYKRPIHLTGSSRPDEDDAIASIP